MPQSLSNVIVHIVFSTKHRYPFIDSSIEDELFSLIGGICRGVKCDSIIVGGHKDHVHILCRLNRTTSQSHLVKEIKTGSSKWIKTKGEQFDKFSWQNGFGIFSVNQSSTDSVVNYIQNQKHHHMNKSYQDEFRAFLDHHNIEYDERYVWD